MPILLSSTQEKDTLAKLGVEYPILIEGFSEQEYVLKMYDIYFQNMRVELNDAEKEELSWQFLYEITDHIMWKCSIEDQKKLEEIGHIMQTEGLRYDHRIIYGIRPEYMDKIREELIKWEIKDAARGSEETKANLEDDAWLEDLCFAEDGDEEAEDCII